MVKLKNNLIGLSGGIGSGKDLVGSIINYIADSNYERLEEERINDKIELFDAILNYSERQYKTYDIKKYADKLKDICCLILGCTREQLEDREFKETPIPQLTKYKVLFNYMYPNGTIQSRRESLVFSTEDGAKIFINSGYWGDYKILNGFIEPILVTPRDLQNIFGTDCGREMIHPNIWCEALFANYKGRKLTKFDGSFFELYIHTNCRNCHKQYSGGKRQYYCNKCTDEIKVIYPNWLITDVRFSDNEGRYIKERNGIIIGVKRKFSLRFPEYKHLEDINDPYVIPEELKKHDETLYNRLMSKSEISMGNLEWCDYIIENNGSIEELITKLKKILWN